MPSWYVTANRIIDVGLIAIGIAAAVTIVVAIARIIGL